jgi:subtilisin family serine protease
MMRDLPVSLIRLALCWIVLCGAGEMIGHGTQQSVDRADVQSREGLPGADGSRAVTLVRTTTGSIAEVAQELAATGLPVLATLSGDTLLVAAPPEVLRAREGVVMADPWPGDRAIAPALNVIRGSRAAGLPPRVPMILGVVAGADLEAIAGGLEAAGAEVSWIAAGGALPQLGLMVPRDGLWPVIEVVRNLQGLVWADVQPPVRLLNSESVWRCQSGRPAATPVFDHGLHGEGQIIGIMDTGIDIDHCHFADGVIGLPALNDDVGISINPFHRKVLAVDFYWEEDWPDPGPWSWDDQGHGSHVAGSAAGDEGGDGRHQGFDGMAPAARLVIQDGGAAVDECADLPGLGCLLRPLEPVLQQAYDQGARIHTNSWGDEENSAPGRYTERTADVDRFVWHHRDFLVFFAGGNAGPLDDTVISPATGKNVVGVGATEHGDVEPPCVASFSSRGWTNDGRIKPDVVGPGRWVASTSSDRFVDTMNCDTELKSGTSMATPTAAGLGALVRQYFVDGFYPDGRPNPAAGFAPSAALVKAALIASAVDLTTLGCSDVRPIPSPDQGWGMIQLDRVLHFPDAPFRLLVTDRGGPFASSADAAVVSDFRVMSPGPLKVVLVWTDPPSSSLAETNLVNDLDLVVAGPDGTFLGNQFVEGVSVRGGSGDRLNNVEVVWRPEARPGRWTVSVSPHRIAESGQDFALVVTGPIALDQGLPRRSPARRAARR